MMHESSNIRQDRPVIAGLSCNLDIDLLNAAIPLFQQEKVGVIEWSFDTLFKHQSIPDWFTDLLSEFGKSNRLIGHGVYFSLFSGKWLQEQDNWLKELKAKCQKFQFDHISEHFGFLTGKHFHHGAPLPVPFTNSVLSIGQDRLKRISEACQCPVGIENLAFAFNLDDVKKQGEFLNKLVDPINGFLILDLHNVFCQLHNFQIDFDDLISNYPLERVREIHVSGGSWEPAYTNKSRSIRRDTHDNCVPEEVFELLKIIVDRCPNLKYVLLEQLGRGLTSTENKIQFQQDFLTLSDLITGKTNVPSNNFKSERLLVQNIPLESAQLYSEQQELSDILENCSNLNNARALLNQSRLSNSYWNIEAWHDDFLETAIKIAKKWKTGF